ncbi:hypothetical protein AAFF_G00199370 [Aldrovandia affinis]|uniref:Cdc42 effector-like domain-containing protein n=1 Tax=Aldrovandia affinis TaxID=143900 RepID=A0AAD7W580_9TELE|nr:hypothetical protein AAFF_G00199370 [Aldrovandia affinis]
MRRTESVMSFHVDLGPSMLGDVLNVMEKEEEDDLGFEEGGVSPPLSAREEGDEAEDKGEGRRRSRRRRRRRRKRETHCSPRSGLPAWKKRRTTVRAPAPRSPSPTTTTANQTPAPPPARALPPWRRYHPASCRGGKRTAPT